MKTVLTTTAALFALALPALAGDAAEGEKAFKTCTSCHMITSEARTIVKGGRTGPNLYGVVGRVAGSVEGFRYGPGLKEAGAAGFIWTEDAVAAFITDPKAWLGAQGYSEKSKMTFRLKNGGEDVVAYLASLTAE